MALAAPTAGGHHNLLPREVGQHEQFWRGNSCISINFSPDKSVKHHQPRRSCVQQTVQ